MKKVRGEDSETDEMFYAIGYNYAKILCVIYSSVT